MHALSTTSVEAPRGPGRPSEVAEVHTRILRLALGVEESRSYWENVDPSVPASARPLAAFEQRWFGAKSLERTRTLVPNFVDRYDRYPEALEVLRRWRSMDAATRTLVCHFHLQLSDPLYRRYTGEYLVARRVLRDPKVDRDSTLRWVQDEYPERWSASTCVQFASKLLSAASEAGLVSAKRDPRTLLLPKVTDLALGYLLHLLRGVDFAGTLTENPYLASVGLTDTFLDQRLRTVRGLSYRRMAHLREFEWEYPSLSTWAEALR